VAGAAKGGRGASLGSLPAGSPLAPSGSLGPPTAYPGPQELTEAPVGLSFTSKLPIFPPPNQCRWGGGAAQFLGSVTDITDVTGVCEVPDTHIHTYIHTTKHTYTYTYIQTYTYITVSFNTHVQK
jgi:hypothetical protein